MRICNLLILLSILLFPAVTPAQAQPTNEENIAKEWKKGQDALESDHYESAKTSFDKVIALGAEDSSAYFNRGYAILMLKTGGNADWDTATEGVKDLKQLDSAISDFSKAIQLDPKDADSYFYRGLSYKAQNNWSAAIADTQKAAALDSQYQDVADMVKGTRFSRFLWPAVLTMGGILCALFMIPFFKAISAATAAEKAGRSS